MLGRKYRRPRRVESGQRAMGGAYYLSSTTRVVKARPSSKLLGLSDQQQKTGQWLGIPGTTRQSQSPLKGGKERIIPSGCSVTVVVLKIPSYNPGEGHGTPLQYSCLKNPMDRGAWQATVHGVQRVRHSYICMYTHTHTHTHTHTYISISYIYISNQ